MADDRVALVGIVDTDGAKANHAARSFDNVRSFDSLETAIAETGPDLVDIATPPDSHLELIRSTMAHHIPTICQKPLCGGLAPALEAVKLAEDAKVPLVVHENFRFQPWYRAIRKLIDDGALGELYQTTFRLRPGDGQGDQAYLDRQPYFQKMKRFLVHETAVHFIDTFRYLMGEPSWVWADLRRLNPVVQGEDAGLIVFGFEDGRRAIFDGNRLVDHAAQDQRRTMGEALVEGSQGVVELTGSGALDLRKFGDQDALNVDLGPTDASFGGGCVARLQSHVIDHLLDGAPLENEAHDYVRNLAIVEAVYASSRKGERIALDNSLIDSVRAGSR